MVNAYTYFRYLEGTLGLSHVFAPWRCSCLFFYSVDFQLYNIPDRSSSRGFSLVK